MYYQTLVDRAKAFVLRDWREYKVPVGVDGMGQTHVSAQGHKWGDRVWEGNWYAD
jgi:hypothetical protein